VRAIVTEKQNLPVLKGSAKRRSRRLVSCLADAYSIRHCVWHLCRIRDFRSSGLATLARSRSSTCVKVATSASSSPARS
jgi:hypothetical protein